MRLLLLSFLLLTSHLYAALEENFFLTVEEYTSFLNDVAASDLYQLDQAGSTVESTSESFILRSGAPGNYHYTFFPGKEKEVIDGLSTLDAIHFYHWKKNHSSTFFSASNNDATLAEQDAYSLAGDQPTATSNDEIVLCLRENGRVALASIDPLLHSSEVSAHLRLQNWALQASGKKKENLTWDGMRVFFSALITIGTLFGEGHFSLEEARRSAPPRPEIDYSENPRIESNCFSSDAVLEHLKSIDPTTRFEADMRLIEKRNSADLPEESSEKNFYPENINERISRAASLEAAFQVASERTILGQLCETVSHAATAIGHLAGWLFYALSPILDNGRRITAGGVIGYGAGAALSYFFHGSFFELMSDGSIGAYIGVTAFSFNNVRDMYDHGPEYREAFRERYQEMKKSFSAAAQSFCMAWNLDEIKEAAAQERRDFYKNELHEYFNPVVKKEASESIDGAQQRSFHRTASTDATPLEPSAVELSKNYTLAPEYTRLLLEAQAHEVIHAAEEEKQNAFDDFIKMGENFYGAEIINYALPPTSREKAMHDFDATKNEVLAKIRCASISLVRQWQKLPENRPEKFKQELVEANPELKKELKQFLEESKKNRETIHDILPELDSIKLLDFLTNHAQELRDYASNELEKSKTQNEKDFRQDHGEALCSLAYHATSLGLKVAGMSLAGFLTGSFIGHEIPLSFSSENLYRPWVEANSMGVAYASYFAFVGSMSQNTIRTSARATAGAYAELCDVWNRPQKQKEAQEKFDRADAKHQEALEIFQQAQQQEEAEIEKLNDAGWDIDGLKKDFPPHSALRNSTMPNARSNKKLIELRKSLEKRLEAQKMATENCSSLDEKK